MSKSKLEKKKNKQFWMVIQSDTLRTVLREQNQEQAFEIKKKKKTPKAKVLGANNLTIAARQSKRPTREATGMAVVDVDRLELQIHRGGEGEQKRQLTTGSTTRSFLVDLFMWIWRSMGEAQQQQQ